MDGERAWARVQTALDERRDPLDDALVCDWFAEHPAELEEYARLERRLERLEGPASTAEWPPSVTRPRRRLIQLAATFAATLLAVVAARRTGTEHALPSQSFDAAPSRIIDYTLTATRTDGEVRFQASRSLDGPLRITNTRTANHSAAPDAGTRWTRQTSETETNR